MYQRISIKPILMSKHSALKKFFQLFKSTFFNNIAFYKLIVRIQQANKIIDEFIL